MLRCIAPALIACTVLVTACSQGPDLGVAAPSQDLPKALSDRNASGEELAKAWFELLSLTGTDKGAVETNPAEDEADRALVRPYLDSSFTLVRASGERYTADSYVPLDVDDFEVSSVVTTRPREDIQVVRYAVSTPGASASDTGLVMSGDLAPRLTVFRWDADRGHWVLASHANFNNPLAAICDRSPVPIEGEPATVSADEFALGDSLVAQWRDVTTGELKAQMLHPDGQIQLADGRAWPTADGESIDWSPAQSYDYEDLSVAVNGDLLVAAYDAVVSDLVMEGDEYSATPSPRLLTFLRTPDDAWQVIALANFTVPQEIPQDADCISVNDEPS